MDKEIIINGDYKHFENRYELATLKESVVILGNANFAGAYGSKTLGTISIIKGDLIFGDAINTNVLSEEFYGSNISNLGNLKEVGGKIDFRWSKIKDFGKLEKIGGKVKFGLLNLDLKLKFKKEFIKNPEGDGYLRKPEFLRQTQTNINF